MILELKQNEYVRIYVNVYLVSHQLFIKKILDTYTESKNSNNTFHLAFLDEFLGYYSMYACVLTLQTPVNRIEPKSLGLINKNFISLVS